MYHATHRENVPALLRTGFRSGAFVAEKPQDAAQWNEVVLKLDVTGMSLVFDEPGTRDLESGKMWRVMDVIPPKRILGIVKI